MRRFASRRWAFGAIEQLRPELSNRVRDLLADDNDHPSQFRAGSLSMGRRPWPLRRRSLALVLLVLPSLCLTVLLATYLLLFHLLPPSPALVTLFRHQTPTTDPFCAQVMRLHFATSARAAVGPSLHDVDAQAGPFAKALDAKTLIERGPLSWRRKKRRRGDLVGGAPGGGSGVPKILHQSWKTARLPKLHRHLSMQWRRQFSDWEYGSLASAYVSALAIGADLFSQVLWTNEDNLLLVETLYPELLSLYQSFPTEIYRADFARNLYM